MRRWRRIGRGEAGGKDRRIDEKVGEDRPGRSRWKAGYWRIDPLLKEMTEQLNRRGFICCRMAGH